MAKIGVIQSDKMIIGTSGIKLAHDILMKSKALECVPDSEPGSRGPEKIYSDRAVMGFYTSTLACGLSDFVDVEGFRGTEERPSPYACMLGFKDNLPSEATVRQRLNMLAKEFKEDDYSFFMDGNVRMLQTFNIDPGALPNGFIPVDLDVSPFDNSKSNKEQIGRTYKGTDGFAPMFGYIGTKGYALGVEMRPGTQHCQKGTPAFLQRCVKAAKQLTDKPLLFRLDSGNDAAINMKLLIDDPQLRFLIKRNFRRTDRVYEGLRLVERANDVSDPREGKVVYTGNTCKSFYFPSEGKPVSMTVRVVYQVTVRTTTPTGQYLVEPDVEVDMYYTSLRESEATDFEVIELYHNHGTSEQFHSEYKTDMDIERFPSGKFDTNALILSLAMLAYNVVRIIEAIAQEMPADSVIHFRDTKRRRIKTILENLLLTPGVIVRHARRVNLTIWDGNPWSAVFVYVDGRINKAA